MGERRPCTAEVTGSIPVGSTKETKLFQGNVPLSFLCSLTIVAMWKCGINTEQSHLESNLFDGDLKIVRSSY